jgi:hypothetical protein
MIIIEPIDVTAAGVFVSSNVPEADYAAYASGTTYAIGNRVCDFAAHLIYESKVSSNLGNLLSDTTKWLLIGSTNRWRMLDQYNNTQTIVAGPIILNLKPNQLARGIYFGNMDADSIDIVVTDPTAGVVYTEHQDLALSSSGSSFYGWCFNPIRKKTAAVSVLLPPYAGATTTITITKNAGNTACGMCVIGPLTDVGLSQYGLGTEIKDYSSTTFNFDGTSSTVVRGFSKRMTIDVELQNDRIGAVQGRLEALRQTPVVWLGTTFLEPTMVFGKYSSFKNIIQNFPTSKMSLQIEGTV